MRLIALLLLAALPSCASMSNAAGALVEHGTTAVLTAGTAVAFGTGYGVAAYPFYRWGGSWLSKKLFDSETVRIYNPPDDDGKKADLEEVLDAFLSSDQSTGLDGTAVSTFGLLSIGDSSMTGFLIAIAIGMALALVGLPWLRAKITAAENLAKTAATAVIEKEKSDASWTEKLDRARDEHKAATAENTKILAVQSSQIAALQRDNDALWEKLIGAPKPR